MSRKKAKEKTSLGLDKYHYYEASVQNVDFDVDFINDQYKALRKGKIPRSIREDFCGTGAMMCKWVSKSPKNKAFGLDLDDEPMGWGKEQHWGKLSKDQQKRVTYHNENVMNCAKYDKVDVAVAFNFSYFIFQKRKELLKYFKCVKQSLKKDGVFFVDLFGGPESQILQEEETEHDGFSYFWDCDHFNPITNECQYYIHFKVGKKKYREAFSYNWRMWGLQELRDILDEAGFSKTVAYWEGDDEEDDGGDGNFYISEKEENCEAWVTYIAALV